MEEIDKIDVYTENDFTLIREAAIHYKKKYAETALLLYELKGIIDNRIIEDRFPMDEIQRIINLQKPIK